MEKEECKACENEGTEELHLCPFQEEIHDNNNEGFCNCCEECTQECKEDI